MSRWIKTPWPWRFGRYRLAGLFNVIGFGPFAVFRRRQSHRLLVAIQQMHQAVAELRVSCRGAVLRLRRPMILSMSVTFGIENQPAFCSGALAREVFREVTRNWFAKELPWGRTTLMGGDGNVLGFLNVIPLWRKI